MSWDPNQGQNPQNPQNPYGGYNQPPENPYAGTQYGQQGGFQQPGGYQQPSGFQQAYSVPQGNVSPLGPSSIGMDPKIAAGLGYLVGIIGIIFFFIEKQNRFVKFHALQAIFLHVGSSIVAFILYIPFVILVIGAAAASSSSTGSGAVGGISLLFTCLFSLLGIAWFVGWLVAMIQAFQGKYFKLPLIGKWADSIVSKNAALR